MKPERAFIDTNLFLRYLTNDVPEQADQVEQLFHRALAGEVILVTTAIVIAEIVWTLSSFYRLSRQDIKDYILAIINTPGLEVIEKDILLEAIINYVALNVDFIDAYNAAWMKKQRLSIVSSFDRKHFSRFKELIVKNPNEI